VRQLRRPLATLLLAVSVVTCSDTVSGPGHDAPRRATLSFAPKLSSAARRTLDVLSGPAFDVQIDRVRVVIVRPPPTRSETRPSSFPPIRTRWR
jgi:hypothetical protein